MRFSVIIPTYNRADLLDRCLESLAAQTYKDFEVLVCDDGSIDNSKEVAERYADRLDMTYIWNENWGGPAHPRNIGIEAARGEWVCFLDSDDWWTPNKLEACLSYLEHYDMLYHDMYLFDQNKGLQKSVLRGRSVEAPVYPNLLCFANCAANSSVVLRRSVVDQVGLLSEDKALVAVEDFDYWLRVSRVTERFLHIKQPLGYYWVGETSISANYKWFARHETLYAKHLPNVTSKSVVNQIEAHQAYRVARYYDVSFGQRAEAVKYYKIALKINSLEVKLKAFLFLCMALFKKKR